MTTLSEFLVQPRAAYLEAFEVALSDVADDPQYEGFAEVIDQVDAEEQDLDEQFPFFRYDVLAKTTGEEYFDVEVNIDPKVFAHPLIIKEGRMEITIESFVWNACAIFIPDADFKATLLAGWYVRWIKPEQDQMGVTMQEVIHSVTYSTELGEGSIVLVDFGSVPVSGVLELFKLLVDSGIEELVISSLFE